MPDRMDQLLAAAARQGFWVTQTPKGVWLFRKSNVTVTAKRTPESPREWMYLINALKGVGLRFPEQGR